MENITALEPLNQRMPREIWQWRDALINEFAPIRGDLIAMYASDCRKPIKEGGGYVQANKNLRSVTDAMRAPVWKYGKLKNKPATMEDDEVKAAAEAAADLIGDIAATADDMGQMIEQVMAQVEELGAEWPVKIGPCDSPEKIRDKQLGGVARAKCARWWRRQIRRRNGRKAESVLRSLGRVQKSKQPYVSNWALNRWMAAQHSAKAMLEQMEAVNEVGEVKSLADAAAGSVSNPVNRRNELMVRLRGYEEMAEEAGLRGLFLTLTAPSKYHACHHYGPKNENFNGASPDQVQSYLSGVWASIRARWAKSGIRCFGFRVAEPHHDGTPHWHLLLFFSGGDLERAWNIFREEALKVDPEEVAGKESVRVLREDIDPERSATGYIAKYISKNIDAYAVEMDEEAERTGSEGAMRARAWASLWGIRQFQQIGSVSVTVWRELRRRKEPLEEWEPEEAEAIRAACDAGDWRTFVELMGGPTCKREDLALRPMHFDGGQSAYGDEVRRLLGIVMRGVSTFIRTREHVWTIRQGKRKQLQAPDDTAENRARLMPGLTFAQKPFEERMAQQISASMARQKGAAQPGHLDLCQ